MVRAVLLDLDDTLFDHQHCAREALRGVPGLHAAFAATDAQGLERSHARILEDLHLEVLAGRLDLDAARVERFRRLYEIVGVTATADLAARSAAAYREGYMAARQPVAGAETFLAAIRTRAAVVIVSNNLLAEQQAKLRACGLAPYVDVLVVSEEAGVSKPDPRIFEIALDRAGVTPDEAVMVGDSWANDIEGARGAGIRAVWFNRGGEAAPDPAVPVLRSLAPTLEAWQYLFGETGPDAGLVTGAGRLRPERA